MATSAEVAQQVDAALAALTGGTRMVSDYTLNERLDPAGTTKYQLRVDHDRLDDAATSNASLQVVTIQILVHHRLADPDDEIPYTQGDKLLWQAAVLDPDFYRDLPAIHDVVEGPQSDGESDRVGNVIAWGVASRCQVALD